MTTDDPLKKENEFITQVLMESAKSTAKWIIYGIIGFCTFGVCLGILGIISVVKVIFF